MGVQVPPPVFLIGKGVARCRTLPPIHTETRHWEEFGKIMAFAWPLWRSTYARRTGVLSIFNLDISFQTFELHLHAI